MRKKSVSSRVLLSHIRSGQEYRQLPQRVRLAMRRWAFAQHLRDCDITAADQVIVDEHPDFRRYIEREMKSYLEAAESPEMAHLALVAGQWGEEREGERWPFSDRERLWFLLLPESLLAERREKYEHDKAQFQASLEEPHEPVREKKWQYHEKT